MQASLLVVANTVDRGERYSGYSAVRILCLQLVRLDGGENSTGRKVLRLLMFAMEEGKNGSCDRSGGYWQECAGDVVNRSKMGGCGGWLGVSGKRGI